MVGQNPYSQLKMASLSPTAPRPSTTTTTTNSFFSFFPNKPRISFIPKLNRCSQRRVSSKATNNDDDQSPLGKFDRRDVLIGLGGLYGVTRLGSDYFSDYLPSGAAQAAESKMTDFPARLDSAIRTVVDRPKKKKRSKQEKEEEEEVLVIDGIEFDRDLAVKFDVYVNDEDDSPSGPDKSEFAGSFVSVPQKHENKKKLKTCLRLALTDLLEDLEAEDDDSVAVTLVPRNGKGLVTVGGLKIEYAS